MYKVIHRVLNPGARFAIADIVLREDLYLETIREAGFSGVEIVAERPAVSDDDIKAFATMLGFDPAKPPVTAHAVTLVGKKPAAD